MKIFDVHVHIYPHKIAMKAAQSIGHFYEDIEMHGNGTVEKALEMMDAGGVTAFAAHSVALTPHNVDRINEFILSAKEQLGQRMVPFAAIHPDVEDLQGTLDRIVAQGFKGIKIHPDMQKFAVDDPRVAPMIEAIAGRLPLLIHCGDYRYHYDGPRNLLNLHANFPKQPLICAHLGGWTEWEIAAEMLPGHNLTVDCSSSLFMLAPERAAQIMRSFGTENVLFGSDYPMWNPSEEVERFMQVPLTDSEREDILWNNAARRFGL